MIYTSSATSLENNDIKSTLCAFVGIFLAFLGLMSTSQAEVIEANSDDHSIEMKIESLNLDQKIGQLFILGVPEKLMNARLAAHLSATKPGAIILFNRNIQTPAQVLHFNHQLQSLSQINSNVPLFIMVDQEGGIVSRIRFNPPTPSALSLGSTQNKEYSFTSGQLTGSILKLLGFNFNLAPVADITNPFQYSFIGSRSFGKDPNIVYEHTKAFAQGLIQSQVIPTFKHYPGHGGDVDDSHKGLPIKASDLETLEKKDLLPFINIARDKIPSAIMTAHLALTSIDQKEVPATYSKKLVTELLREKYHYEGLVITDDLLMSGAFRNLSIGERAAKALEAGCDLLMVAWNPNQQIEAINYIKALVMGGKLNLERIHQSLRRILLYKSQIPKIAETNKEQFAVQFNELKKKFIKLSKDVTQENFNNQAKRLNTLKVIQNIDRPIVVFSAYRQFFNAVKLSVKNKTHLVHLNKDSKVDPNKSLKEIGNSIGIFYVSGRITAKLLNSLTPNTKSKIIVINTTYPGIIKNQNSYMAIININQRDNAIGKSVGNELELLKIRKPAQVPSEKAKKENTSNNEALGT